MARGCEARALEVSCVLLAVLGMGLGCQRCGYDAQEDARDAGLDAAMPDASSSSEAGAPAEAGTSQEAGTCDEPSGDGPECDDGLTCTTDEVVFDPETCQATCSHTMIERAAPDDGCCPPGSDADTDSDCGSLCGNGMIEPGEACDDDLRCLHACTVALPISLVHRYSFDGSDSSAIDSIGLAEATIMGSPLTGTGEVDLDGDQSEYVELPANILMGLTDATFETWVVWRGGTVVTQDAVDSWKWQRIFDFGTMTDDAQMGEFVGQTYLFMTPLQEGTVPHVGFKFDADTPEVSFDGLGEFPRDVPVHVAVVFDDSGDLISLYIDGEFVSSVAVTGHLSDLEPVQNCWLGRSLFSVDRYFDGTMKEFRIYDAALSAQEVAMSYATGPDP